MPRSLSPERFWSLVHASQRVFAATSFKRAAVADIASEAGLSTGLVYRYFDGKEALLYAALLDSLGALEEPESFPLLCEDEAGWAERLEKAYAAHDRRQELQAIFAEARSSDELARLLARDLMESLGQRHLAIRILDRSARDLPRLHDLFYRDSRSAGLETLTDGLAEAADRGLIAKPPHLPGTARWILESAVWFAVSRRFDPHPGAIDDDDALATLEHVFCRVLAPAESEEAP